MPWSSQAVFASIIIVEGDDGGVFIYDSSNNLVASVAELASVDPVTSSNLTGITAYGTVAGLNLGAQMNSGELEFLTAPSRTGPWTAVSSIVPGNILTSATNQISIRSQAIALGPQAASSTDSAIFLTPSGNAAADTNVIAEAFGAGYTYVILSPGLWNVNCGNSTLTSLGPGQYLCGSGKNSTIVTAAGTGIVFAWTFVGVFSAATTRGGGFLGGATIDLTSAGNGSEGIRAGNIFDLEFDVEIVDTSGRTPALKGFHALNDINYTENMKGYVGAHGCTITFDVSDGPAGPFLHTSTGSFKGIDMKLYTNQRGIIGNNGLEVHNGANLYDGTIRWTGNFEGAASGSAGAALDLTGTVPAGHTGAGNGSSFRDDILQWGPEVTNTGVVNPVSINFGAASNVIAECAGVIDFGSGADLARFAGSNWPGSGSFFGPIAGDTTLAGLSRMAPGPVTLDNGLNIGHSAAAQALVNASTITTAGLTYAPCSLAAAVINIVMQAGTFDGQFCYVSLESTVASGFTVTFAAAGSNVRDPADTIAAGTAALFVWNAHVTQWIRVK